MMRVCVALVSAVCLCASFSVSEAQVGIASYYKHGRKTANGERFNPSGMTAAHRTLKFGTRVKVTHLKNGRSVVVRINDRGPFGRARRILDLSYGAAKALGFSGTAKVDMIVLQ